MTPIDILTRLRAFGLTALAEGGNLIVRPRTAITDETRTLIRDHKAELLAVLQDEAASEFFEERAAVREFDGNMTRAVAEAHAEEDLQRYRQGCWERLQRNAMHIREQPDEASRERALQRYRQAAEVRYGPQAAVTLEAEMRNMLNGQVH